MNGKRKGLGTDIMRRFMVYLLRLLVFLEPRRNEEFTLKNILMSIGHDQK